MANPDAVYEQPAGARDHYLEKPAFGSATKVVDFDLKGRLKLKSESAKDEKNTLAKLQEISQIKI